MYMICTSMLRNDTTVMTTISWIYGMSYRAYATLSV